MPDDAAGTASEDWPKPWEEIVPTPDSLFDPGTQWVDFGPFRGFAGTVYVNAGAGSETADHRDLWMPLDCYIARTAARTAADAGGDGDE